MVDQQLRHAPYNPRSAQGFAVAAAPSRVAWLDQIQAPTLVLHGERDHFFPLSHAAALAAHIPNARLMTIPELGHGLPLSHFFRYRDDILANLKRGDGPEHSGRQGS